jgi:cysteine-rich repeat protein
MRAFRFGPLAAGLLGILLAPGLSHAEPATPGDLLVTELSGGSVVNIKGGGDFELAPRFATGLDSPAGICVGPGGHVYVTELFAGRVKIITDGGDFAAAPAFATGLDTPINLVCSETEILVAEWTAGRISDITAGGDFSGGAGSIAFDLGGLIGLFRDSSGLLWGTNQQGAVYQVVPGVPTEDTLYAENGGDLRGVTERTGTLLVSSTSRGQVLDISAIPGSGDLDGAEVFATVPSTTEIVDLGPIGLFSMGSGGAVHEISAGGDYVGAAPFASGIRAQLFADLAMVRGCGDSIVDPETEECDDGNTLAGDSCSPSCVITCAPAPETTCTAAAAASVALDESQPGRETLRASLSSFTWSTTRADFGDPVGGATRFSLCLYDESDALALGVGVDRAGDTCGKQACWKASGTSGFAYKDKLAAADGVSKLAAKSGAPGKGSVALQAGNDAAKGLTSLPTGAAAALAGETAATLQLRASDGACFSASLTSVQTAEGSLFEAETP